MRPGVRSRPGDRPPSPAGGCGFGGQRVNQAAADAGTGLRIERIGEADFREFVRVHGSSPEIGPIATYLDGNHGERVYGEPHLFGLSGCGVLCAVACCTVCPDRSGKAHAGKLDSVVVHGRIRRGGLGAALVTKAFQHMLEDPAINIASLFSYAVHPATVAMLRRLGFSEPPARGAPLSSLEITETTRQQIATRFRLGFQNAERKLALQCAYCRNNNRRARPWCAAKLR